MMQFQFIPAGGNRLAASIDLPGEPDGGGPWPVVIVVHGLTGQRIGKRYHLVEFARRLNDRGIACVRFDQSGCGESTGRFVDLTIGSMIDDLGAVRAWACEQSWCDADRCGLLGLSLGALPVVASDARRAVGAIALWAPVYDMPRVFNATARSGLRALVEHQGWVPYRGLRIGAGFVNHLGAVDTPAALAGGRAALLLCHSRDDDVVPYAESEAYAARCRELGRPCELIPFDRADHDFGQYDHRQQLLARTLDFYESRLIMQAGA